MNNMKAKIICLFFLTITLELSVQAITIELTKSNPKTLIGSKSSDYSISGIRLGITRDQAWKILEKNNSLVGIKDKNNLLRIYVYSRNPDGSKAKAVLYLIWEPDSPEMESITIFQDYRSNLSRVFRRLLTLEAINNNSEFKKNFIGAASKCKITLDIPSIKLKHTVYIYDKIGLKIIHKHSSNGNKIVFALFRPKLYVLSDKKKQKR